MSLEQVQEAIKSRDIDALLTLVKLIKEEELEEAIKIYENYYERELNVTKTTQDIIANTKSRRLKVRIPVLGSYTYKLEN